MSTIERQKVESPAVQAPVSNPRDALLRAADLIEERGWCQNHSAIDAAGVECVYPEAVAFCAGGAINYVADIETYYTACDLLDKAVGMGDLGYITWNDDPERTKAEVVARLREAAERSEHE